MYKYKFQICELAHAQIEEKRGVPAGICRSCIHDPKVVAWNTKIDQQIYLLMAGKGLKSPQKICFPSSVSTFLNSSVKKCGTSLLGA